MSAALELRLPDADTLGKSAALIERMTATVEALAEMDTGETTATRRDAAMIEAAAHQAQADDLEIAAARLRLYAERRLGQLGRGCETVASFSRSQTRDFQRLAEIPTHWRPALLKLPLSNEPWAREPFNLFERSVEYQLKERSHTAYTVWRTSLKLGCKVHAQYRWLSQAWDGTWLFWYEDPKSKRVRQASCEGDITWALEYRAILSGKAKQKDEVELLPIRGRKTDLGAALDNVRSARIAIGVQWDALNGEQKRALDGAYGHLDDLARAIVEAMNL